MDNSSIFFNAFSTYSGIIAVLISTYTLYGLIIENKSKDIRRSLVSNKEKWVYHILISGTVLVIVFLLNSICILLNLSELGFNISISSSIGTTGIFLMSTMYIIKIICKDKYYKTRKFITFIVLLAQICSLLNFNYHFNVRKTLEKYDYLVITLVEKDFKDIYVFKQSNGNYDTYALYSNDPLIFKEHRKDKYENKNYLFKDKGDLYIESLSLKIQYEDEIFPLNLDNALYLSNANKDKDINNVEKFYYSTVFGEFVKNRSVSLIYTYDVAKWFVIPSLLIVAIINLNLYRSYIEYILNKKKDAIKNIKLLIKPEYLDSIDSSLLINIINVRTNKKNTVVTCLNTENCEVSMTIDNDAIIGHTYVKDNYKINDVNLIIDAIFSLWQINKNT